MQKIIIAVVSIFLVVYFLSSFKYAIAASCVAAILLYNQKPSTNAFEGEMCPDDAPPHRLPACDGQYDPIQIENIEDGDGHCMNGRCYSLRTLADLYKNNLHAGDPMTRQPYSSSHKIALESIAEEQDFKDFLDSKIREWVGFLFSLAQHYARVAELRISYVDNEYRRNKSRIMLEIDEAEEQIKVLKRILRNDRNNTILPKIQDAGQASLLHTYLRSHLEQWLEREEDRFNLNLSDASRREVRNFGRGYLKYINRDDVVIMNEMVIPFNLSWFTNFNHQNP